MAIQQGLTLRGWHYIHWGGRAMVHIMGCMYTYSILFRIGVPSLSFVPWLSMYLAFSMIKIQVQGVSYWNVLKALRCRRTNNCVEIWCLVASGGVDIWVSWPSFQRSYFGWPQQPPAEKVLKSVKNWIFDDEFHKKWQLLVILVPRMIQPSESGSSLVK